MIYETEEEIYIDLKVMSEDLELETFKRNSCPYSVEDEEWCEEDLQKNPEEEFLLHLEEEIRMQRLNV